MALYTRTRAHLLGTPDASDLTLKVAGMFALDTDPTQTYRVSSDSASFVPTTSKPSLASIAALRASSLVAALLTGCSVASFYGDNAGGQGEFYADLTDTTTADDGGSCIVDSLNVRWKARHNGVMTLRRFGAKGDGTTADDAAITAAMTWQAAGNKTVGALSDKRATRRIHAEAGNYKITSSETLMSHTVPTVKTVGCYIEGDGAGVTIFTYTPTSTGTPMLKNWRWLRVRISGIEFYGTDATADFLSSEEQGGTTNISDYLFQDCVWSGTWRYVNSLTGSNNNSEWRWVDCAVAPSSNITAFLFTPATNAGGSDQFLNYWFIRFKFWPTTGAWLDMASGGHIKILQPDVSGWTPTVDTYLFNLRGTAHSSGVTSFKADGLRCEMKSDHALLLFCEWDKGNVSFDQTDMSSQSATRSATLEYIKLDFSAANTKCPQIKFTNSSIAGRMRIVAGQNAWRFHQVAAFENCTFMNVTCADDFVQVTDSTAGHTGGWPVVEFDDNCRSAAQDANADGKKIIFPSSVGWHKSSGGLAKVRHAMLLTRDSNLPTAGGTQDFELPRHAALRRLTLTKPAGGNAGAFSYTLQTSEGTPTVLATFAGADSSAALEIDVTSILSRSVYEMDIDTTRQLRITDTAVRGSVMNGGVKLLAEYQG